MEQGPQLEHQSSKYHRICLPNMGKDFLKMVTTEQSKVGHGLRMSVFSALGRYREKDQEVWASLGYMSSRISLGYMKHSQPTHT